jgi:hypothetical protein
VNEKPVFGSAVLAKRALAAISRSRNRRLNSDSAAGMNRCSSRTSRLLIALVNDASSHLRSQLLCDLLATSQSTSPRIAPSFCFGFNSGFSPAFREACTSRSQREISSEGVIFLDG